MAYRGKNPGGMECFLTLTVGWILFYLAFQLWEIILHYIDKLAAETDQTNVMKENKRRRWWFRGRRWLASAGDGLTGGTEVALGGELGVTSQNDHRW